MTAKRSNPRKDFTQVALDVVKRASGEDKAVAPKKKPRSGGKTVKTPIRKAQSG